MGTPCPPPSLLIHTLIVAKCLTVSSTFGKANSDGTKKRITLRVYSAREDGDVDPEGTEAFIVSKGQFSCSTAKFCKCLSRIFDKDGGN